MQRFLDLFPLRPSRRFRLFFSVLAVVLGLSLVKAMVHWSGLEFLTLNALFTSAIAAAVFIIGFLLSSVLADYKEAERLPADIRVALESIHDEAVGFARANPPYSAEPVRRVLRSLLAALSASMAAAGHADLRPAIAEADRLTECLRDLEGLGMLPNYLVRLKAEQGVLRRSLFRLYHIQKIQFVPSVHILARTLVASVVGLLMLLKTEGSPESALIFGFIVYLFTYALYLIDTLEQPFRKGSRSLDDVSLFLLTEFEEKLE